MEQQQQQQESVSSPALPRTTVCRWAAYTPVLREPSFLPSECGGGGGGSSEVTGMKSILKTWPCK